MSGRPDAGSEIYIGIYCSLEFICRYASDSESGEQTVLESMKDYLINTIQRTFEIGPEKAECLYGELLQCTRKKNLVSAKSAIDPITATSL